MKSADGRECSKFVRGKTIALSGKRTTRLYLSNPEELEVEKIEVDGCAITEGLRCDWLVLINDRQPQEEIYVELKSSKIDHAVEQLEATIKKLSNNRVQVDKRCLIVSRRGPKIGTDVQKHIAKFRKKFNAAFQLVRDGDKVPL
jgi:hypothetical protein